MQYAELRQQGHDRRNALECCWRDFTVEVQTALTVVRAQWEREQAACPIE
jgi:hypothetical protein